MSLTTVDTKTTAQMLRTALRKQFPGTRFSVRMARGSAHGWLDVSWTDGPAESAVREVVSFYEGSRFDGQTDTYHQTGPRTVTLPGDRRPTVGVTFLCCGVLLERRYSVTTYEHAARRVAAAVDLERIEVTEHGVTREHATRALTEEQVTALGLNPSREWDCSLAVQHLASETADQT